MTDTLKVESVPEPRGKKYRKRPESWWSLQRLEIFNLLMLGHKASTVARMQNPDGTRHFPSTSDIYVVKNAIAHKDFPGQPRGDPGPGIPRSSPMDTARDMSKDERDDRRAAGKDLRDERAQANEVTRKIAGAIEDMQSVNVFRSLLEKKKPQQEFPYLHLVSGEGPDRWELSASGKFVPIFIEVIGKALAAKEQLI